MDLSLDRVFDYRIPDGLQGQVHPGSQVMVPFGRQARRKGFVVRLKESSEYDELKEIIELAVDIPLINETAMKLAHWMAGYYAAPLEKALQTVIPGAVRRRGKRFKEALFVESVPGALERAKAAQLEKRHVRRWRVLCTVAERGRMLLQELIDELRTTSQTVRQLEKDGYVTLEKGTVERNPLMKKHVLPTQPLPLMDQQKRAFDLIRQSIDTFDPRVVLLHGVTGSGKTEVYLQALGYALEQGKGAIILVPEISLTPQTVERFQSRFGDRIAVLHSHLSEGERHDEWHRLYRGEAMIVIGARSALFAPVKNPGLIVVDEEHENSYKQDEAPRYNARDVAVMRGHVENCTVVLGSATPALESFYNARIGKYALVEMFERADHRQMPAMRIVDMRVEKQRAGKFHILSKDLVTAIDERLQGGEQVILFLNRRGFSTSLQCPACGFVAECCDCSIAMTYHKTTHELRCHLCGRVEDVPERCPNQDCRDHRFKYAGFGTQRIEEVVRKVFQRARVERMDSDVTRRKDSYERILGAFRGGKIDILIGTQMIAKGLHFPNVTLVGVINADVSLHMPDFRAGERTFQLLTQVAGRAGRGEIPGEVIVQTYTPANASIQAARRLDYAGFCDQELAFREELRYPPYTRLACITVKGKNEKMVEAATRNFERRLRAMIPTEVGLIGAAPAPIARIKGFFRYQLIMRAPRAAMMAVPLRRCLTDFKWPGDVSCQVDIDALSLL